jgi:hypothetical protein
VPLKGWCHKIFWLQVFLCSLFPQAPKKSIKIISNFLKILEIFASPGAPQVSTTLVANLQPVSTTPAENFYTGTDGFVGKLPPLSTTPAVNLPLTPVANNGNNIRLITP